MSFIEQQELTLLHKRWLLRRTKEMIANQLPEKGNIMVISCDALLDLVLFVQF